MIKCVSYLKIIVVSWGYGRRSVQPYQKFTLAQSWNAYCTTWRMEYAHIAGGTLCINRERGNLLKCKLRNCRMRSSSIHCRYRWLLLCKCCVSYCFVFVVVTAKIATKFEYPKIFLLFLIKIAGCRLKIAIRHPKISGLKIAIQYPKIAGLKIIARVCVCVCMRVGAYVLPFC